MRWSHCANSVYFWFDNALMGAEEVEECLRILQSFSPDAAASCLYLAGVLRAIRKHHEVYDRFLTASKGSFYGWEGAMQSGSSLISSCMGSPV